MPRWYRPRPASTTTSPSLALTAPAPSRARPVSSSTTRHWPNSPRRCAACLLTPTWRTVLPPSARTDTDWSPWPTRHTPSSTPNSLTPAWPSCSIASTPSRTPERSSPHRRPTGTYSTPSRPTHARLSWLPPTTGTSLARKQSACAPSSSRAETALHYQHGQHRMPSYLTSPAQPPPSQTEARDLRRDVLRGLRVPRHDIPPGTDQRQRPHRGAMRPRCHRAGNG